MLNTRTPQAKINLMRVVIDTNIIVSGLLWSGIPHAVLTLAQTRHVEAITSEALVDELRGVLLRDKFQKRMTARQQTPEQLVLSVGRVAFTRLVVGLPMP